MEIRLKGYDAHNVMTRTWKKLDGISHFHLSWSFKGHTKYIRRCMSKQNLDLNTKLALSKGFVVTVESKEKYHD